jgi:hypothetical protein
VRPGRVRTPVRARGSRSCRPGAAGAASVGRTGEGDTLVQEPPLDVGAAVLEQGEADLRARRGEPGQRAGEEGRTETRRGEQRQAAIVEATGGADRRACRSDRGEDLAGVAGQDLTGSG